VTHAFPQEWETVDVEAHVVRQRRIDLLDRIFIAGAGAAGLLIATIAAVRCSHRKRRSAVEVENTECQEPELETNIASSVEV